MMNEKMKGVRLLYATESDADEIMQLIAQLAESEGTTSSLTEEFIRQYLYFPGSHILLAEGAGQAFGLISFSIRPNLFHGAFTCTIDEVIVDPKMRRQGIGRMMLNEVIRQAKAADCAEISLSTMPDNVTAIRFYKAHGLVDEALYLEKHF